MIKLKTILLALVLVVSGLYPIAVQANNRFNTRVRGLQRTINSGRYKAVYDNELKRIRYFDNKVIVRFKPKTDRALIQKYLLKNNLRPISKIGKRAYVCRLINSDSNPEALISLIETQGKSRKSLFNSEADEDLAIEELDLDEYKNVSLNNQKKKPLYIFSEQWHLKNNLNSSSGSIPGTDINVEDAWNFSKGLDIKIAVIDTGFDLKHKDINYYNEGFDVSTNKAGADAPRKSRENHGTAVAGIIAGLDNNRGIVGVAPKAQIIPIRLITDDGMVSISQIIAAHQKAVELGAVIINNSWGSFDPSLKDGETLELTQMEKNLYRELEEEANNGKGVLVIFASGNSGRANFNNAPEARNPHTFSVGASNIQVERASYSSYGPELDLVAPGGDHNAGIITTDRRDIQKKSRGKNKRFVLGYNKGNYANNFIGTSAAAPVVSGVAALVWSLNPSLNVHQVKEILRQSALKDLGNKYQFANGKNPELGYGIVDAGAAVRLAMQY
jgi:subtilisin family serine protease